MIRRLLFSIPISLTLFASLHVQAESADPVILSHGNTVVRLSDLKRGIESGVPADKLGMFYADQKRIRQFAGNFFMVRKLAEEAAARKLTEQEQWQVDEARARALSQAQIEYLVAQAPQPDFEALALERYRAQPDLYSRPEAVRVEHVLVSKEAREPDAARARAAEVLGKIKDGATPFADLAKEYSDDPSVAQNAGDLGFFERGKMVKPFEDAAFSMKEAGEVVGPVETQYGFHVIRLIAHQPKGLQPFDEVKAGIIASQKSELRTEILNANISRIGSLEGVTVDYDALMTLHKPLQFGKSDHKHPGDGAEKR